MVTKSSFDLFGLFIKFFNISANFKSINNKLSKRTFLLDEFYLLLNYFFNNYNISQNIDVLTFSFIHKDYRLFMLIDNFFILGSYLEYLRMFFYNDHLRYCPLDFKKDLHIMSSDREYLNRQFIINILLNKYVIYLKLFSPLGNVAPRLNLEFVAKFFFTFNLLTKPLNIVLNNSFFVRSFSKWLFFYYILFIYKN